jgi:hypothetical protein
VDFETWVEGYRKAWLTNDRADIEALFTDDAAYYAAPYTTPARGRDAIVEHWLQHADAPGDTEFGFELLATDGDVGVVRGRTLYTGDPPREYHNLWVIQLDDSGRCSEFTEWWMKTQ